MIKCIIVEDDPIYSKQLCDLLESSDSKMQVVSICRNVKDALIGIDQHKPELIFLDIELQGNETGFDLLKQIDEIHFSVIFTTSHVDENINRIRICGIGFIIKPYIYSELKDVIEKYIKNRHKSIEKVSTIKGNLHTDDPNDRYIFIENRSESVKVEINNIIFCQSDDPYTSFYLKTPMEGKDILISSRSIKEFEQYFAETNITRIHNRYLANIKYIKKYMKGDGGTITLDNGKELPVSKTYKSSFLERFGIPI